LLEEAAKICSEPFEEKLSKIKNERKRIKLKLEYLQNEVRNPLTEWEEKEKLRLEKLKQKLLKLENYTQMNFSSSVEVVNAGIELVNFFEKTDFEERKKEAALLYLKAEKFLVNIGKQIAQKEINEREEKRLRTEEQKRIKAVEEENARLRVAFETEQREKQLALDKERKAQEALLREEKLKLEAQERERINKEKSEIKAKETAERAEREKQAAIEADRKRIADEAEATHQREELRKSEEAHKEKIHKEIHCFLKSILENYCDAKTGLIISGMEPERIQSEIYNCIENNKIPHVKIVY
jgi:hypothetical protein